MSLISIFSDLTGLTAELREIRLVLSRIADALDRAVPPPYIPLSSTQSSPASAIDPASLPAYGIAESPEEYQARTSAESALAVSLGFAPWSPAFQETISQMRADLMRSRIVVERNEEGNPEQVETPGLGEDEANAVIREAFQIAKSEANVR